VLAHYRTEADDLARVLDAPNLSVRALLYEGHVVAVALLALEGGLDADLRARMYESERVQGNMLPDVLTSQLGDEAAGRERGLRVLRIATHHAVRSRGLGSRLLAEIRTEAVGGDGTWGDLDWLGTGYGATPNLLRFWAGNGYRTISLSTSRNAASGEHSALMLDPLSPAGEALYRRHARWFGDRAPAILSAALSDLDPDVARAALRAAGEDAAPRFDLTERDWRLLARAAAGPGHLDTDPRPFRTLAVHHLVRGEADLTDRQERLLVRLVLQAQPARAVADELGYHSTGGCLRALGDAVEGLIERHGTDAARAELDRHRDGADDEANGSGSDTGGGGVDG